MGVLGGVGLVDFADVGEVESVVLLGEYDLLGLLGVMASVAAGRPVRKMDVVFIVVAEWYASNSVWVLVLDFGIEMFSV